MEIHPMCINIRLPRNMNDAVCFWQWAILKCSDIRLAVFQQNVRILSIYVRGPCWGGTWLFSNTTQPWGQNIWPIRWLDINARESTDSIRSAYISKYWGIVFDILSPKSPYLLYSDKVDDPCQRNSMYMCFYITHWFTFRWILLIYSEI